MGSKRVKELQERNQIVKSLINLRTELSKNTDTRSREIMFKINSCLFSEYPHKEHVK